MINVHYVYNKLSEEQQEKLKLRVEKKLKRLERLFGAQESESVMFQVTVDLIGQKFYQVKLALPSLSLFVSRESDTLLKAFELAFSDFKEKLLQRIDRTKLKPMVVDRRAGQLDRLMAAKHSLDATAIHDYSSLRSLIQPLRRYILRLLRAKKIRLAVSVTVDDILSEVLALAYQKNQPRNLNFEEWLYQLAHTVTDRLVPSVPTETLSVEALRRMELSQLEEIITADADDELVLVDELDADVAYHHQELDLPQDVADYLDQLSRRQEVAEITRALALLDDQSRRAVELVYFEGYEPSRAAAILTLSTDRLKTILQNATAAIRKSLGKSN